MLEETTEEFNQKVCQHFNTSLQQVRQDVKVLKEWIRQQPHLPQCSSDALLTTFLVACKNRMERAKEKIDNYYTARLELPDFFSNRDPTEEKIQTNIDEIRDVILPKTTPDGCRVTIGMLVTGDVSKFDLLAWCKRTMAFEDVRFNLAPFCTGDYVVLDCKRFSAAHVLRIIPTLTRDFMYCVQDAMPIIVKGVFLINSPPYIDLVINIMKPFIKNKIFKRIHIYTEGVEVLEKHFPIKLLPKDYGGEEETIEKLNEAWRQLLIKKRDWLMGEGSLTVDEKKRIGGTSTKKGLGLKEMQGSFKTLCVD